MPKALLISKAFLRLTSGQILVRSSIFITAFDSGFSISSVKTQEKNLSIFRFFNLEFKPEVANVSTTNFAASRSNLNPSFPVIKRVSILSLVNSENSFIVTKLLFLVNHFFQSEFIDALLVKINITEFLGCKSSGESLGSITKIFLLARPT